MATDLTLMVLPTFTGGEGMGLPQIFIEQKGMWRDLSVREAGDASQVWSAAAKRLAAVMAGVVRNPGTDVWPAVRMICMRKLYENLVPRRLHDELQRAAATADGDDVPVLRVHTPIDWIPWELMHDGTDFLGLRFHIARLPIGPTVPDFDEQQQRSVERIYNLLAENLLTPGTLQQWQGTFSGLTAGPAQEIRFPSPGGAGNDFPTLGDLEDAQAPDILHVTCHGGWVDDEGKAYWTLNHKGQIYDLFRINTDIVEMWGRMRDMFARQPLVFGNACASVKGYEDAEGAANGHIAPGFGPTFFSQGAVAFVGTLMDVSETLSVPFACEFYRKLLGEGLSIAKALWATKKHFSDLGGNDPCWLFYCLYGRPETRFQIAA